MAILTGVIRLVGKLGGIRNFRKLHDPNTYASETGSIGKKVYKTSAKFKNCRLSNVEFGGCALAVKGIRNGLYHVIPEMVDSKFTERLMKFARELTLKDSEGVKGKRLLRFSAFRSTMQMLYFNNKHEVIESAKYFMRSLHSDTHIETTLDVNGLIIKMMKSPSGATHYRIFSHLSVVSDYCYSEFNRHYDPTNSLDGLNAFAYSELVKFNDPFTTQIKVVFPEGTVLGEDCTVIHCVAIEFMEPNGIQGFRPIYGASLGMMDVF